jgi:hypothetical protein
MIVLKFRVYLKNFYLKYLDNAFHKGASFSTAGLNGFFPWHFLFLYLPREK